MLQQLPDQLALSTGDPSTHTHSAHTHAHTLKLMNTCSECSQALKIVFAAMCVYFFAVCVCMSHFANAQPWPDDGTRCLC